MSWFGFETAPAPFPKTPATRIADPVDVVCSPARAVSSLEAPLDSFRWSLDFPAAGNEAFTFYFSLDDGAFALVQLVYSTLGLGPSIQMILRWYNADKTKFCRTLSPAVASFLLSDDNRSVTCEEFSFQYVPGGGYKISVNIGEEAAVDVSFEPVCGGFKVNDGRTLFGESPVEGFVEAEFVPKATVIGSVTFDGVKKNVAGSGLFLHALQCSPQYVSKWTFLNFQTKDDSIMLYEFDMPKESSYALTCASTGSIVRNGKLLAVTTANRAVHVQKELDDAFSGYEVPTQLFLVWTGKTKDTNEDVRIEMSILQANMLDRIDVLSELPFLLRKLIQTFVTAPFVYQWYEDVVARVTVGGSTSELRGRAFVESTFLMFE
ncbi:putative cell survival pathways protein [Entophlyctis sp. JEL0112]|nr:putative cell survival pathways protein [Entophlyctis sp. JEL0112]